MKQYLCKLRTWIAIVLVAAIVIGLVGMLPGKSDTADTLSGETVSTGGESTSTGGDTTLSGDAITSDDTGTGTAAVAVTSGETVTVEDLTDEQIQQVVTILAQEELTNDYLESLTDEEVDSLVAELLGQLDTGDETVTVEMNEEYYDENGAMTIPFDQAYPELVENGSVVYDDETLLIKLSNSTDGQLTDGLEHAGVAALEAIVPMETATWYEAKLVDGTDAQAVLEEVRLLSEVLLAEYNYELQTADIDCYTEFDKDHDFTGNDRHKDQWFMHHCGIPDGMSYMTTNGGSSSVIVAVIDTGVDYDHEDLAQNMWYNSGEIPGNGIDDDGNGYVDDYYGIDLVYGSGSADDDNGHGTHVAGIIAAQNNNLGVVGIAYNVKIMPIKAASASGVLNQSNIAKAVLYAYEMGAEVINMSFGGTACSIAVQDALATAYTRCVLVASAGNDGAPNEGLYAGPNYPAALSYVLGVMSVDENGVESSFTNYDVTAYNAVEYELYAPGEAMVSTLPNDKYGSLSGTSMAAPVVSAMAAILRSEFTDRDKYPTKFIYGQLCSTSGYTAECCDPDTHGTHNLPQIVNLYAALTEMPKPEVNLQDYDLFDTEDISAANSGDGVIDAGETIALGLTLRNRWGMSENTLVTIDTLSTAGIADPYITIENDTVNYGSVGTYSTKNCGAVYTDELLTGWENPFYITIAEDCPNDYTFKLNVTITCENALDEADETVYTTTGEIWLTVRNGVVLPSIIEEDMTLTADNLYIIPNSTTILEGVTVRVEAGTHIQFWSDDPEDPYADDYIAYLLVNGCLYIEGTKEDPVYIYPSDLMSAYNVEFGEGATGYISMVYADITNFGYYHWYNSRCSISYAEHCTFRLNYTNYFRTRYVSNGNVSTSYYSEPYYVGSFDRAVDCVFYKYRAAHGPSGTMERCLFADCAIDFQSDTKYQDCVFLGNQLTGTSYYSTYTARNYTLTDVSGVYYRAETGTTYVVVNDSQSMIELIRALGGDYLILETKAEYLWLSNRTSISGDVGIYYNGEAGEYTWSDGTSIGSFLDPDGLRLTGSANTKLVFESGSFWEVDSDTTYGRTIYEIPGDILPTELTFPSNDVPMDMETVYQLSPMTSPVQLPIDRFVFESSDESVVTVDEKGLVTPVGEGTADVYVYYKDRALYNYVTFTVGDYVALDSVDLTSEQPYVAVGETLAVSTAFTPADTTRQYVTYASSDEAIATVDVCGQVTGVSAGEVTITATCDGKSAELTLEVYKQTTTLTIDTRVVTGVVPADAEEPVAIDLPTVTVDKDTTVELEWSLLDPSIGTISEDGKQLIVTKAGFTELTVTELRSGLSDTVTLYLTEEALSGIRQIVKGDNLLYVLTESNKLYFVGSGSSYVTPTLVSENVALIDLGRCYYDYYLYACLTDGTIMRYTESNSKLGTGYTVTTYFATLLAEEQVEIVDMSFSVWSNQSYAVVTSDGSVYTWGYNTDGMLGLGSDVGIGSRVSTPTKVDFGSTKIVNVYMDSDTTTFLTEKGDLYVAGGSSSQTTTPTRIARNVTAVSNTGLAFISDDTYYEISSSTLSVSGRSLDDHDSVWLNGSVAFVLDGDVYSMTQWTDSDGSWIGAYNIVMSDIGEFTDLYLYNSSYAFVGTESGLLYGSTISDQYLYDISTGTYKYVYKLWDQQVEKAEAVLLPYMLSDQPVTLLDKNLTSRVITVEKTDEETGEVITEEQTVIAISDDTLTLTFSQKLLSASVTVYEGDESVYCDYLINGNIVTVSLDDGFQEGVTYTVTIAADGIQSIIGQTLEEDITLTFVAGDSDDAAVEYISLTAQSAYVKEGTILPTTAVISPADSSARVTYTSSDETVATVDACGNVTGVSVGEVTITATCDGVSAELTLTVCDEYPTEDPTEDDQTEYPADTTDTLTGSNVTDGVLRADTLKLNFCEEPSIASVTVTGDEEILSSAYTVDGSVVSVEPNDGFRTGVTYTVVIGIEDAESTVEEPIIRYSSITFTWQTSMVVGPVAHASVLDTSIQRYHNVTSMNKALSDLMEEEHYNPYFNGNAILNPISTDTDVTHWLRVMTPTASGGAYYELPLGGNYWGTTNETAIGYQIVDYTDFATYYRAMYSPYLTEAPENTFPFVTGVTIYNESGEEVTTVGNETITVQITFNRDMDTSIDLQVRFGSAAPYGDYEISGSYIDARTWQGTYTLNTLIENGNQYWSISNGCSATEDLELYADTARFGFVIDTTAAQALIMQGEATDTGIQLKWTQDDFDTLMGYNVYRSTAEDGYYTRLNSTVIPADTMEFFDDTVEPGVVYYYNFTVVQTDLTESEPSGKISIMSKDTMAPNIYHSPVSTAFTGSNLVVSATITDNLNIAYAYLYYRVAGTEEWHAILMNDLNSKYSAIIPADYVTLAGIEYYIDAFDGVNHTYKASAEDPYTITVQEAVDASSLGDVNGDGQITTLDALYVLQAINDKLNLNAEQFARADLDGNGVLEAKEALRILQYANGLIGSVVMT